MCLEQRILGERCIMQQKQDTCPLCECSSKTAQILVSESMVMSQLLLFCLPACTFRRASFLLSRRALTLMRLCVFALALLIFHAACSCVPASDACCYLVTQLSNCRRMRYVHGIVEESF